MEYKFQHCYCAKLDDSTKFSLTPHTFPDSSFCLEPFPHISVTRLQASVVSSLPSQIMKSIKRRGQRKGRMFLKFHIPFHLYLCSFADSRFPLGGLSKSTTHSPIHSRNGTLLLNEQAHNQGRNVRQKVLCFITWKQKSPTRVPMRNMKFSSHLLKFPQLVTVRAETGSSCI